MNFKLVFHTPRALLAAGLLLGAVAAQAASGYTVSPRQEALVKPGMSTSEVQSALGQPDRDLRYRNEPGPTFTYRVAGSSDTLFDVDFDANGTVASAGERIELMN